MGDRGRQPKKGLELRDCANTECGKRFQPYRDNQHTCSRECYKHLPSTRQRDNDARKTPEYREHKNEWRRTTPAQVQRAREYNRKKQLARSGWTAELYAVALAEQGGVCKVCGQPPKPGGIKAASRLHADHDHTTGKNRDLLCSNCNQGLGYFKDDPALLRAAAEYVERHRQALCLTGARSVSAA